MTGGLRGNRYGTKFEDIFTAAKREGKRDPQVRLRPATQPLLEKRPEQAEEEVV